MPTYSLTEPSVAVFPIIAVCLAFLFIRAIALVFGARGIALAAVATAIWMAGTLALSVGDTLRRWDATPPPFMLLIVAIVLLALAIAFTSVGARIAARVPLWALIAAQSFRLPLELDMHRLALRGIMPTQMSYTGFNFDIITGATAIIVAVLLVTGRAGRRLAMAWNVGGLLLLLNVVVIALLSTPRFHLFGMDRLNVFVTYPPFVWLPSVMVLAALTGHLLIFRALRVNAPMSNDVAVHA